MDYRQPVQVTPVTPPRQGVGVGAWFAVFFALALLVSVGINLMLLLLMVRVPEAPQSPSAAYNETLVDGEADQEKKILIIDISGPIMPGAEVNGLGMPMEGIVGRTISQLKEAQKDASIRAIILNMETPGGAVDASEMIYNEVKKTKQTGGGKKIIVQMNGVTASGGYYIAAPADSIVAHPTTITGSIGVIAEVPVFHKALEYLNVEMVTIKAGSRKDWGHSTDPFTPEERAYFQSLIDKMYSRFTGIVAEGRGIPADDVLKLATGEVYMAEDAKALRLVDEIGFLDDAIRIAREQIGDSHAKVIRYSPAGGFLQQLFGARTQPLVEVNTGLQVNVNNWLPTAPRFLYLWKAGE